MKRLLPFFGALLSLYWGMGQNLIENPSFELSSKCPEELGNLADDVDHWSVSTSGTTDYFNQCSTTMGVPKNFNGEQDALDGQGYAGFYLIGPSDYREYVQGTLTAQLKAGQKYSLSFYVSLSEKSNFAIRDIGVLFTHAPVHEGIKKWLRPNALPISNSVNFMELHASDFLEDKERWVRVHVEFEAKGFERYITIGNFRDNSETRYQRLPGTGKNAAYYYLDSVSLYPGDGTETPENYALDKAYVLKSVLFDKTEFVLSDEAKQWLKKLYGRLRNDPSLFLTIHAHTDNDGGEDYNKNLSQQRADAVAAYLVSLGLAEDRIRTMGHGDEDPVAENTSLEGKQKNRRAEVVLSKKKSIDPQEAQTGTAETHFEQEQTP